MGKNYAYVDLDTGEILDVVDCLPQPERTKKDTSFLKNSGLFFGFFIGHQMSATIPSILDKN